MDYKDELMHYGVLGMKWGRRKAQKRGETYTYKSHTTKKYEKKAAKAERKSNSAKAEIYKQRAKRSAKFDAKEQKQSLNASLGKTLVARSLILNNTLGASSKSYQRYKALGDSTVRATLKAGFGNYPLSMITKANYIRGKGRYASQ